jgi:hypothetical protein
MASRRGTVQARSAVADLESNTRGAKSSAIMRMAGSVALGRLSAAGRRAARFRS